MKPLVDYAETVAQRSQREHRSQRIKLGLAVVGGLLYTLLTLKFAGVPL